jgi:hypothetical protein
MARKRRQLVSGFGLRMSNERIDLKQFEDLQHSWRTRSGIYDELFSEWIEDRKEEIMAELKKMYAREDELLDALRIIRDDLDEAIAQGHLPIKSTDGIDATKIRNFANDATQ